MHMGDELNPLEKMILATTARPLHMRGPRSKVAKHRSSIQSYLNEGYPAQVASLLDEWHTWKRVFDNGFRPLPKVRGYRLGLQLNSVPESATA